MEDHKRNNQEDGKKIQSAEKLKRLYKMCEKEKGLKEDHKRNDEEDLKKIQRVEKLKGIYKMYDKDTAVKGQVSSTPVDTSGVGQLAQELAVSENVRSDLEDKREVLQQQKLIFQQSASESKGEVNMLENKLRELQADHKELQATYRVLEKKYDKMCIETEFKDRDGKTQESIFETKITESRSENEKLLKKISQIEEDLALSQENLQITSVERDSMQKVVEELEGKVTEQEEQMKNEIEEIERRLCEVEGEKLELLQKMKAVEKSEVTQQRSLSDVQTELKEQSSLVVSLEKKVSALIAGYQWLNKLKEGSALTEIPDLDATSSLTLKDVSFFVVGLQDRITSISNEKQALNELYQSVSAKNSELQRYASISKEKILNLENSIAKFNENEETLKKKIADLQGVTENDSDNMKHAKEEVIMIEKKVLELIASLASLEQEKCHVSKELDLKDQDLLLWKKEIEKCKEELNKSNEMTGFAVKNAQECLEKVKPLEQDIKERDARIEKLLQEEKQWELTIRSMEKQDIVQRARFGDKEKEIENLGNEVKKQIEHNESLKQNLNDLRSEKDLLSIELKSLNEKVKDNERQKDKLEEKMSEEKQKYELLKSETERLESEDLITFRNCCSDYEVKLADLENQLTKMCSVKDQLEVQLEDTSGEVEKKNSETQVLQERIKEMNIEITGLQEENEIIITQVKNLDEKCKMSEGKEKTYQTELESKSAEISNLKDIILSNESTIKESKEGISAWEEQEVKLKKELEEAGHLISEFEMKVNEKSEAVGKLEQNYKDLKDIIEELEADKKQLVLDLKTLEQEKDSLRNKATGDLDMITELKNEVNEIKQQRNNDISRLEIVVDKLKVIESSLTEEKELAVEEANGLSSKIKTLEMSESGLKQSEENLKKEVQELKHIKETNELKFTEFQKQVHELQVKVRQIGQDKETSETDLRQAKIRLETKTTELVKNLEDAVTDLQVIKMQLNNTSSQLESTREENICLEKSLHESDIKNEELEQKVECLKDQAQSVMDDLGHQLKEREAKIAELEKTKDLLLSETDVKLQSLQQEKAEIVQKLQLFSDEIELLKRNIGENEKILKTSQTALQTTKNELENIKLEKESLVTEISQFKDQLKEKDVLLEKKTEIIDQFSTEKFSLTEQFECVEISKNGNHQKVSELNKHANELTIKVQELCTENDVFKEEQQRQLEKEITCMTQLKELSVKNKRFEEQCAMLQEENENVKSIVDQDGVNLNYLEDMLKEKKSELEHLERENEKKPYDSEAEVDSLRQEIATLEIQHSSRELEAEQSQKETWIDEDQKKRYHAYKTKFERPQENKQFEDMKDELEPKKETETHIQTQKETGVDEDQKKRYDAYKTRFERLQENKQLEEMKDVLEIKNETETYIQTKKETGIDEDQKKRYHAYKTMFERPQENKQFGDMKDDLRLKNKTETPIQTKKETGIDVDQKERYHAYKTKFERPQENKQFEDAKDKLELKNATETHIQTKKETGIDEDQKKRYHAYKTKFERPQENKKIEDMKDEVELKNETETDIQTKKETGIYDDQKERYHAYKTKFERPQENKQFEDMKDELKLKNETETHIQTKKETGIDENQKKRYHAYKTKFKRPQENKQFEDMKDELELKNETEADSQTKKETGIDEDQKKRYHAYKTKFERPQENKKNEDMKDELELKNETETDNQAKKETGIDEDQKKRYHAYRTRFERPQENKQFEDMKDELELKNETETDIQTEKETGIDEDQKKKYHAFKAKFERPQENKQFEDIKDEVELINETETDIQTEKVQEDTAANPRDEKQHIEEKKATFPSLGDTHSDGHVTSAKGPSSNTASTTAHGDNPCYEWTVSRNRYPIKSDEDKVCNIHGCCQLPSGEIILADNHNQKLKKLKIIDDEYKLVNVIYLDSFTPWDVCYIGKNEAVVVLGTRLLMFVDILRNMVLDKSVETDHSCRGVASRGNRLYVIDHKSVHSYTTDGTEHRVLYKHQSDNQNFRHIAVSDDDSKIYITVQKTGLVTIDNSGNHIYTFTDPALQIAYSLCVDDQGHVWICDKSRNILQISSDGTRKLGMIKNSSKLIDSYETLCFDMKKSVLISAGNSAHITVLKLDSQRI